MLNISKQNLIKILFVVLIATILLISGLFIFSLKNQGFNDLNILKQNQTITTGLNSKYTEDYNKIYESYQKELNSAYLPWTLQDSINKIFNTNKITIDNYTVEVANVKTELTQSLEAWKTGITIDKDFDGKTQALKDIQLLSDNVKSIVTVKDLEAQKKAFTTLQQTYQFQLDIYNKKAFLVGVKSAENDINDLTEYLKKFPKLSASLESIEKYKTEITNISNEESLKKISYQDLENKVNNDIRPLLSNAINAKDDNEAAIRQAEIAKNPSNIPITRGKLILIKKSIQTLYAYENGALLLTSPVTTGQNNWATDNGTFSILTKERNRRLIGSGQGATWNVFVSYWMLFNAQQEEGIHDASWRNGKFGGQDYTYTGSRGCVNTPDESMVWLYNWSNIGTPVVVQD